MCVSVYGSRGHADVFHPRDRYQLLQAMNNVHANWYKSAVEQLITAVGKRTLKQSSQQSQLRYNFCLRTADDLTEKAKCALNTFQQREKQAKKAQFYPKKNKSYRRKLRRRRSAAYSNSNNLKKPNLYYFANTVDTPITPSTTPYPSPMEALSRLVINALRPQNDTYDSTQHASTVSKLRQLHSLVEHDVDRKKSRRVEILSPRLAPLLPRTTVQSKRIYSPSFFSFYKDSAFDNVAALPKVLDDAGMTSTDQVNKSLKEDIKW